METKPKNTKTPARVDTTLSQAILNLSLGIPGVIVLYLLSCNISENKKFQQELKLADKKYSLESLKIVTPKPFDSIILKSKFEKQNLTDIVKSQESDKQLLELENKINEIKIKQLKINAIK